MTRAPHRPAPPPRRGARSWPALLRVACLSIALSWTLRAEAAGEPTVAHLRAAAAPTWLTVAFEFQGALTPAIREASAGGVPLVAIYEIEVIVERWWWWNGVPFTARLVRELRFDAAKGLYLLDLGAGGESRSYPTLEAAAEELLSVPQTTLPIADPLPAGEYLLRARASLEAGTPASWFIFGAGPEARSGWSETPLTVERPKERRP